MENGARERRELERAVVVDCRACRSLCEQVLASLLDNGRADRGDDVVRALMTAAAITETAATWLDEEQRLAAALLEFCADSCEAAAARLAQLPQDPIVRECCETCRACADTVRALLYAAFDDH